MMANLMDEDDIILWTRNQSTFELKPKLNEKRVTFGFAADAFDEKDGVNDLIKLRSVLFGAVICNSSLLSEGAKKLVDIVKSKLK